MLRRAFIVAALAACPAMPGFAADRLSALGTQGEVYTLRAGSYADLFPGGQATAAANPVLALDVAEAGSATQRLLVPGSESAAVESNPFIVYEESSATLYLVWQSIPRVGETELKLGAFRGGQWGGVTEIRDNVGAAQGAPQ